MTSSIFAYDKLKTIQALRYHFISRKEIKYLMIIVNLFAIISASLFFLKKILLFAFLFSSLLWFVMMILFWFLLPRMIYAKSASFKDKFKVEMNGISFSLIHERADKTWEWNAFSIWMESPHFFHIYFNPRSFFLVPKEAFEPEEIDNARKILSDNIKRQ
jgi:uncharacterized membrane protein YcgQ (UPF0703/DUF1980 family)